MKSARVLGTVFACLLGATLTHPAVAQRRPTIVIMLCQYFSATAESAKNITQGLDEQFRGRNYTVVSGDQAQGAFQQMGLNLTTHYADAVALRFGRQLNADLVAYPRLLAVGVPLAGPAGAEGSLLEPGAVMHLRVLNVRTGGPIYFRQISHEFSAPVPDTPTEFNLPQPVATATAEEVLEVYFRTIAGSQREMRGAR